jgi:hypothetical protein
MKSKIARVFQKKDEKRNERRHRPWQAQELRA